jgi:hypothetical protein
VPVVYTNALNNTYINADGEVEGGLYVEAKTIYTRIAPTQGSQILTKIGVLSGGRLAEVNQATLLLGDQKRENFGLLDITTEVSSGAFTQAALGGVSRLLPSYQPKQQQLPRGWRGCDGSGCRLSRQRPRSRRRI